jgi:hypothetical protein
MGPTSLMVREFHTFDNIFDFRGIIENEIIDDFKRKDNPNEEKNEVGWDEMIPGYF